MNDNDWKPLREWEPEVDSVVLDAHHETRGRKGVVLCCDRYGHFADPYWRVSVRWESGRVEHSINAVWLTREDGTQ